MGVVFRLVALVGTLLIGATPAIANVGELSGTTFNGVSVSADELVIFSYSAASANVGEKRRVIPVSFSAKTISPIFFPTLTSEITKSAILTVNSVGLERGPSELLPSRNEPFEPQQ